MTHAATAERVAAMLRYQEAWNVLLAAYADLVEGTDDPALKQRHATVLQSFVSFRESQADYYTWLGLMMIDVQATVNEIRGLIERHQS